MSDARSRRSSGPQPPSARQLEILAFMKSYIAEHGMPPTITEIAKAHGIASTNAVSETLVRLRKIGLVRHTPMASRGWRPA